MNGRNSDQFKDFPFIPVVTAPKIVLLVPDKLMQNLNTRTQVLMATIFNTWPMLIFIIVSAMLAGLTVWLLVSSTYLHAHLATSMTQSNSSIGWSVGRLFSAYSNFLETWLLDQPISGQYTIWYPLKTRENQTFSGIFRGYKMGTLVRKVLKKVIFWRYLPHCKCKCKFIISL